MMSPLRGRSRTPHRLVSGDLFGEESLLHSNCRKTNSTETGTASSFPVYVDHFSLGCIFLNVLKFHRPFNCFFRSTVIDGGVDTQLFLF